MERIWQHLRGGILKFSRRSPFALVFTDDTVSRNEKAPRRLGQHGSAMYKDPLAKPKVISKLRVSISSVRALPPNRSI